MAEEQVFGDGQIGEIEIVVGQRLGNALQQLDDGRKAFFQRFPGGRALRAGFLLDLRNRFPGENAGLIV